MTNFTVTLAALREEGACIAGYNKVVRAVQGQEFSDSDRERETYILFAYKYPIPLILIVESNGIDDGLWALRCVPGCDRDARLFAVWCARQVQHQMTDARSTAALDVVEAFANGDASKHELAAARAAARDAAGGAAWDAARAAQKRMFIDMCNGSAPWQVGAA